MLSKKFFSVIPVTDTVIFDDDDKLVDIEMLRVGTFNHSKYGELDITAELLSSLVDNFNGGVIRRDVSFDWNHNAKEASGWLKGLDIVDDVLVGSVQFTPKGRTSIEEGEYGYFSVEFLDDFEDAETGDAFGPTLTGGALTNRPFISGLQKISFEDPDVEGEIFRLKEGKRMPKKKEEPKKEEVVREPVVLTDEEKAAKVLEDLETEKKVLEDKVAEMETKLEEQTTLGTQLSEVTELVKSLDDNNKKLAEKVTELEGENVKKDEKTRELEVDAACEKLMSEEGHHRSVVEVARELMLADATPDTKVIKLSETIGEGEEAKTIDTEYTMSEAITKLLEAIPASQRKDFSEKTKTVKKVELDEDAEAEGIRRSFAKKGIATKKAA